MYSRQPIIWRMKPSAVARDTHPAPGGVGLGNEFARIEHLGVQGKRQQRVKHSPGAMTHRVLKVAEVRQCLLDEGVELLQSFGAIERPGQLCRVGLAEAVNARGDDRLPEH